MQAKNQVVHRREFIQRVAAFMVAAFGFDVQMVERGFRMNPSVQQKHAGTSSTLVHTSIFPHISITRDRTGKVLRY
ncbi:hypothetical protein R3I93_002462 [Phoxinus phoxinus]|uniref:Uncharacterized protein n=1 Tax=Phoxinus phoxinus TaxID=58324 RepID=A0AAN9DKS1_9TELE